MTDKLIAALDARIARKEFYDSEQYLRAIFDKFSKNSQFDTSLTFALDYGEKFAELGETELSIDLGEFILKLIDKDNIPITNELINTLTHFFELNSSKISSAKYRFMNKIIALSKNLPNISDEEKHNGLSNLHYLIGNTYAKENNFHKALNHLILVANEHELYDLIIKWQPFCYFYERDLLFLKLILYLFVLTRYQVALKFLKLPVFNWNENISAPLQAAYLLAGAIENKDADFFSLLQKKYALIFRVDADFTKLLSCIGTLYFNIKKDVDSLQSLINSLLK